MSAKDVRYRVRNWSTYNDSLKKRGSLTLCIDEETIKNWYAIPTGKAVQQFHYSDAAIQLALSLRAIYRLPLRATQGFLQSVFKMMNLELDVPDCTTICRRAAKQKVTLDYELPAEPMHLALDSTGLKIFATRIFILVWIYECVNTSRRAKPSGQPASPESELMWPRGPILTRSLPH